MRTIKSIKGFQNDKRNILEATSNLVVFGQGQHPELVTGRRPILRRGNGFSASRRLFHSANSKSRTGSQALVPGPGSTMKRLDHVTQMQVMSNYFLETKPWNGSTTNDSHLFEAKEHEKKTAKEAIYDHHQAQQSLAKFPAPTITASKSHSQEDAKFFEGVGNHICPVCLKGFEPRNKNVHPSDAMTHSRTVYHQKSSVTFRKNLEDGWGMPQQKHLVKPQDVVVAANCGELFHKVCLRDWCSRGHQSTSRIKKPNTDCPSCGKELKYTLCQEIETVKNFSSEPTALEREYIKTKLVNKELQLLWPETNMNLMKLLSETKDADSVYKQLRLRKRELKSELKKLTADDLSVVMSKVTNAGDLKEMLEKQEKVLAFMQQETLQIMRMYILTLIRKRKLETNCDEANSDLNSNNNCFGLGGKASKADNPIPVALHAHIENILNDDHSLHLLSRIVSPLPEDFNDDKKLKCLELEILQKYDSSIDYQLKRTSTYTVISSAVEVGDTESCESSIRNNDDNNNRGGADVPSCSARIPSTLCNSESSMDEDESESCLKIVSANCQIPSEKLSRSSDLAILKPRHSSQSSLPIGKPSRILQIQDIRPSEDNIVVVNSSAGIILPTPQDMNNKVDEKDNISQDEEDGGDEKSDEVGALGNFRWSRGRKDGSRFNKRHSKARDREDSSDDKSDEVGALGNFTPAKRHHDGSWSSKVQSNSQDEKDDGSSDEKSDEVGALAFPLATGSWFNKRPTNSRHSSLDVSGTSILSHIREEALSTSGLELDKGAGSGELETSKKPSASDTITIQKEGSRSTENNLEFIENQAQTEGQVTTFPLCFNTLESTQSETQSGSCDEKSWGTVTSDESECDCDRPSTQAICLPLPEQQVSIAIIYIVESEDSCDDECGSEGGTVNAATSALSPIFVQAEKTSNYSIIAGDDAVSDTPKVSKPEDEPGLPQLQEKENKTQLATVPVPNDSNIVAMYLASDNNNPKDVLPLHSLQKIASLPHWSSKSKLGGTSKLFSSKNSLQQQPLQTLPENL